MACVGSRCVLELFTRHIDWGTPERRRPSVIHHRDTVSLSLTDVHTTTHTYTHMRDYRARRRRPDWNRSLRRRLRPVNVVGTDG